MGYEAPGKEQRRAVAEQCHGYRNKTTALVGGVQSDEIVSCETCLRWHNRPCSIYNEILTKIEGLEG